MTWYQVCLTHQEMLSSMSQGQRRWNPEVQPDWKIQPRIQFQVPAPRQSTWTRNPISRYQNLRMCKSMHVQTGRCQVPQNNTDLFIWPKIKEATCCYLTTYCCCFKINSLRLCWEYYSRNVLIIGQKKSQQWSLVNSNGSQVSGAKNKCENEFLNEGQYCQYWNQSHPGRCLVFSWLPSMMP